MNRLWVRISLVMALVAVMITLAPLILRELGVRPGLGPPEWREQLPPDVLEQIPPERYQRFEESLVERIWRSALLTGAIGGGVGLGVGILLSRSLVKPLNELEKGARALAAHDLAYRVPEGGSVETKAVAQAFNNMAAELEQSETLRRNMLADVTHELRHPVHVLRGNLQGILDGVFPLTQEEIGILSDQTHHLARLVEDLHDLALAEARELPMHPQEVVLATLVRDSVDAVHPLAAEKHITLNAELPAEPVLGFVDAGRMRQVIQNLLSNAIRFTPERGAITISLAQAESGSTLVVRDKGRGILAEDLPRVFDRFYQADASRDREFSGAGLGLAIVKAIVESHEGRVAVTSPGPDQGTTFTVWLPAPP